MPLDAVEIARRDSSGVVIRPGGVRVRWELNDLDSADGQSVRAVFRAAIRPLEGAADKQMLKEAFLAAAQSVSSEQVAEHFLASLQSTARRATGDMPLQSLLSETGRTALSGKLAECARGVAFGCGLELLPPFDVELDSPSLRRQQDEARQAAAQSQRLAHAAEIFRQFEEIRRSAPELSADQIFQRLGGADPTERAQTLRLLLVTSARLAAPTTALWAVAGPHVLKIELPCDGQSPRTQVFTPPPLLGPLRSIQRAELNGKSALLAGARCGVLVIDPAQPNEAAAYADPAITSSLGFNAVIVCAGKIWASHGEGGVVGWDVAQRDQPVVAARPGGFSPRNLFSLDAGRMIFTSEHRIFELFPDGTVNEVDAPSGAPVLSIIQDGPESLVLAHEDGQLCRHDRRNLNLIRRVQRTGRVVAAGALPWLGSTRILLACESGPLSCVGMEDDLVMQYASPYSGLRLAAAAADRVAAITGDRQRIILWPSWDGNSTPTEIHVAAVARHRAADIEFA